MEHVASSGERFECLMPRHGRCRLCDLIATRPAYARLFDPNAEPPPEPAPRASATPPLAASIPLAGDLVEKLAHRIGADRAAKWIAKALTGVPSCGCEARRIALNKIDARLRKWLGLGSP